jgi:hypothetical protein
MFILLALLLALLSATANPGAKQSLMICGVLVIIGLVIRGTIEFAMRHTAYDPVSRFMASLVCAFFLAVAGFFLLLAIGM